MEEEEGKPTGSKKVILAIAIVIIIVAAAVLGYLLLGTEEDAAGIPVLAAKASADTSALGYSPNATLGWIQSTDVNEDGTAKEWSFAYYYHGNKTTYEVWISVTEGGINLPEPTVHYRVFVPWPAINASLADSTVIFDSAHNNGIFLQAMVADYDDIDARCFVTEEGTTVWTITVRIPGDNRWFVLDAETAEMLEAF